MMPRRLADAWSPDAVYLNRNTGDEVTGRAAIAEQFTAHFKDQPEVKLELNVESIRFVSPNVAVEQGVAKTLSPKTAADEIGYSAVFVRRDGQWLLDRVMEKAMEAAPTACEQLKPLEWMIGHWVDKDDKVDVETDCKWTKNRSYISRHRSRLPSKATSIRRACKSSAGTRQPRPSARGLSTLTAVLPRSTWTYKERAAGSYATKASWPTAAEASMVNVIKPVDQNSYTWQTVERTAGGANCSQISTRVRIVRE